MPITLKNRIILGVLVALSVSSNLVAAQGFDVSLLTDCWEWIIGYSTESCTATCAQVGRTCDQVKTGELNSLQALSDAISTSFLLGSPTGPGTMASFCNGGVNVFPFADAPAAFAYQTFVPNANNPNEGVFVISHYCYFPSDPSEYLGTCDTEYIPVPSQRICSCYNGACAPTFAPTHPPLAVPTVTPTVAPSIELTDAPSAMPTVAVTHPQCDEWILGYSTESCTTTCNRVGGTCNGQNLETITTQQAFYDMVTVARTIDASCPTGYDADIFCTKGVNTYSYAFAPVPAAFSYRTHRASGRATETFCNYPVTLSNLTANCDAAYVYPPSRRFCSCTSDCPPPTAAPTTTATDAPTLVPTVVPTFAPSTVPTIAPSRNPTVAPTIVPSVAPTKVPTAAPSVDPSVKPTVVPTIAPTLSPTVAPSVPPTVAPSNAPSTSPSAAPTVLPSLAPTAGPTITPSTAPTQAPSKSPSAIPTIAPSVAPSAQPSVGPTAGPTVNPTTRPPTLVPTAHPSVSPSRIPTAAPTGCFKFIIGYSEKSCTQTCGDPEVNGVCERNITNSIDSLSEFSTMLTTAMLLGSGGSSPSSVASFCSGGVNVLPFAKSPAAFAYQQYVALPSPHYVVSNYCYYRPAAQGVSPDTCDTKYITPPSQRICACRIPSCVDNGAYPVPNYRRLEGEEEESENAVEALDTALTVSTSSEQVEEVLSTVTTAAVESVKASIPVTSTVSVLQNMLNEMPMEYQIAGAAAVVLALLCAFALYNTLTVTKTTPAPYCSSPTKGVTWAATLEQAESSDSSKNLPQASRNPRKREVYIEMPEM